MVAGVVDSRQCCAYTHVMSDQPTPSNPATLSGHSLPPAQGGSPRHLVVLLHGVGADARDLIALGAQLRQYLPHAEFVAPDGPEPCDFAPHGRQWFSLRDRDRIAMRLGARAAAPVLDAYIDGLLAERGMSPAQLALVGFSQGTMMAMHVALRRPEPVAAVVGFSGTLLDPDALAGEIRARPPMMLVHGEMDIVVPFQAMVSSEAKLREAGVPVDTVARPGLDHTIDREGMTAAAGFLARHLPA